MRALSTASPLSPSVLPGRRLSFLLPFALPLVGGGVLNCFHSLFLTPPVHREDCIYCSATSPIQSDPGPLNTPLHISIYHFLFSTLLSLPGFNTLQKQV